MAAPGGPECPGKGPALQENPSRVKIMRGSSARNTMERLRPEDEAVCKEQN